MAGNEADADLHPTKNVECSICRLDRGIINLIKVHGRLRLPNDVGHGPH